MKKALVAIVIFVSCIVIFNFLFSNKYTIGGTCTFAGGWGRGESKSCDCIGKEVTLFNQLPVDGDLLTTCIGIGVIK